MIFWTVLLSYLVENFQTDLFYYLFFSQVFKSSMAYHQLLLFKLPKLVKNFYRLGALICLGGKYTWNLFRNRAIFRIYTAIVFSPKSNKKCLNVMLFTSQPTEVRNIWVFFSPLVPSKREKNILVLLSLYIFWGKCVYFSIFEW